MQALFAGHDYPRTYREFVTMFPDDIACAAYLERLTSGIRCLCDFNMGSFIIKGINAFNFCDLFVFQNLFVFEYSKMQGHIISPDPYICGV
jgi:hypothetical protein